MVSAGRRCGTWLRSATACLDVLLRTLFFCLEGVIGKCLSLALFCTTCIFFGLGNRYFSGGILSICTTTAMISSQSEVAPSSRWRATSVACLVVITGFSVWLHWSIDSIFEVCTALLTVGPAIACAASTHPPSLYTRRVFKTVFLCWAAVLAKYLERTRYLQNDVSTPLLRGFAANQQRFVGPVLYAYFICSRLFVLEEGFQRPIGARAAQACFFLQVVFQGLAEVGRVLPDSLDTGDAWDRFCHCGAGTSYFLAGVIAFYGHSIPLRALWNCARDRDELASHEVRWAMRVLMSESLGALLTTSSTAFIHYGYVAIQYKSGRHDGLFMLNQVDAFWNMCGMALLSGVPSLWSGRATDSLRSLQRLRGSWQLVERDPRWRATVKDLGTRGVSLEEVVRFYAYLRAEVEQFRPSASTLADVVELAVIPLTRLGDGGQSMATLWSNGAPRRPDYMVTHTWSNTFTNLVASLLGDVLESRDYAGLAQQLVDGKIDELLEEARRRDGLQRVFWICAFCVNQHSTMCHVFGCPCSEPKGPQRSAVESEVNKFDDMMSFMRHRSAGLAQIVAMDEELKLLSRAWCVAELVQAYKSLIPQRLHVHSAASLKSHSEQMEAFDVRRCQATDPKDVDFILAKITNKDSFNQQVRALLHGSRGLLAKWPSLLRHN